MDSRNTLVVTETFEQMLKELFDTHARASLLYDDQGLTRVEGVVRAIISDDQDCCIRLDNGQTIPVKQIIAVNGVFLSDYSEC